MFFAAIAKVRRKWSGSASSFASPWRCRLVRPVRWPSNRATPTSWSGNVTWFRPLEKNDWRHINVTLSHTFLFVTHSPLWYLLNGAKDTLDATYSNHFLIILITIRDFILNNDHIKRLSSHLSFMVSLTLVKRLSM